LHANLFKGIFIGTLLAEAKVLNLFHNANTNRMLRANLSQIFFDELLPAESKEFSLFHNTSTKRKCPPRLKSSQNIFIESLLAEFKIFIFSTKQPSTDWCARYSKNIYIEVG